MTLPSLIAELPVAHLQLSGRAANALARHTTIAEVLERFGSEGQTTKGTVESQGRRVIGALVGAVRRNGLAGWDQFRKTRPLFAAADAIYFYSPSLDRLSKAVAGGRLGRLHLSRRAITALHAIQTTKIADLVRQSRNGIVGLRAAGELTATEICESLDALADSVREDGSVDWVSYAERRRFSLLPAAARPSYSAREFLWDFPKVCEQAVTSKFGAAGTLVLRNRIFRHRDILVPLSEIGRRLGHTRERARLLEAAIMKMLRRAIWREEYRGCRFRFRPEFLQPLYQLRDAIDDIPAGALSLGRWRTVLDSCWGVAPEDLGQLETVFLQLLDLEAYFSTEASIILPQDDESTLLRNLLTEIRAFVASHPVVSFRPEDLQQRLLQTFQDAAPNRTTLTTMLDALPTIERDPTAGGYRTRFEHLKDHVDRCERILREHGVPMHFEELAAEIALRLPNTCNRLPPRQLASRMAGSKRFAAIGKTGRWSLREWNHVETRTIGDVALECIAKAGTPLSEKELFDLITAVRPATRASLGSYLKQDGRFRRVAPAVWTVAESALSDSSNPASREEVETNECRD